MGRSHKTILLDSAFWGGLDKTAQYQHHQRMEHGIGTPKPEPFVHDRNHNGEFADWLQEHGDPRHVIVRHAEDRTPDTVLRVGPGFLPGFSPLDRKLPVYFASDAPTAFNIGSHSGVTLGLLHGSNMTPVLHWHAHVPRTKASGLGRSASYTAPVTPEQLYTFIDGLKPKQQQKYWSDWAGKNVTVKPLKLARMGTVVDSRPFLKQIQADRGNVNRYKENHTFHSAQVLADKFAENGDPREELIRDNYSGSDAPQDRADAITGDDTHQLSNVFAALHLPDRTTLELYRQSGPKGHAWIVYWENFRKIFTHPEFREWLKKWPTGELKKIIRSLRYRPAGNLLRLARGYDDLGSTQHKKRLEIVRRVLNEAGLKPNVVKAAIANGDRASVLARISKDVHPDLARYTAAWLGLLTGEPAMTVFHPDESGPDRLHVFFTDHAPDQTSKVLKGLNVPQFAVESRGTGSRAFVLNHDITPILNTLNGRNYTIAGRANGVGNSQPESH